MTGALEVGMLIALALITLYVAAWQPPQGTIYEEWLHGVGPGFAID